LHARSKLAEIAQVNQRVKGDVRIRRRQPFFSLHRATYHGRKEIVERLIAKGADVNAKTDAGRTPLDRAIVMDKTKIADLLRKHGGKTGEELKAEGK
jgi:ankyrin repeat protein